MEFMQVCWKCLTLNGSIFYSLFASIVMYYGALFDERAIIPRKSYISPELGEYSIPTNTIHTQILMFISNLLTPQRYLILIRRITQKIKLVTKITKRSFLHNIIVFFLFYYLIVSAPAAVMIPVNYKANYDAQSYYALFLMMLTNAIGDVLSFKITLNNINRLFYSYRNHSNYYNGNIVSLTESILFELKLYSLTIIDMLMAALIFIWVLLMTSIYFGVSIGEYDFEISNSALHGALDRITSFWDTAWEPYWFKTDTVVNPRKGLPMLLVYSLTSFVPSLLMLVLAIFWTLTLPLRIIYYSKLPKIKKICISESVVICICSITFYVANKLNFSAPFTLISP